MPIEGFVILQRRGRYGICNPNGNQCQLKIDDRIEVDTGKGWIEMRVGYDFEGYYLDGKEISFYPKMVYARLVENGKEK
ncbi:MAG TPA: hypothetical protein DDW50_13015 [Firmicutes bacterium]|jgi:hypothetical protein|nr:hypothetical protein [Bacillota bacterium]